jgi:mannose-6-phosphate isomerase
MSAIRLHSRPVHKIWGQSRPGFGFAHISQTAQPIGEIWFETPGGDAPELLVKYLFTSEKLSVQVHPDDAAARAAGFERGKDECWLILAADPGAQIGLGLNAPVDADTLRAAARDGSIEAMLDWREVKTGEFYYLPAGTIHAIGAGLTLIEVQQNVDLTYRLYDYGRPRDLHLDRALRVAQRGPWLPPTAARTIADDRRILTEGRKFVVELWKGSWTGSLAPESPTWLVPISGRGRIGAEELDPGETWLADTASALSYEGELLIAYPGDAVVDSLWAGNS